LVFSCIQRDQYDPTNKSYKHLTHGASDGRLNHGEGAGVREELRGSQTRLTNYYLGVGSLDMVFSI